jgi:FRG domain.
MVLRHYSVKTRLLDWSGSPYVAAYFAVHDQDTQDGELWSFDRVRYEEMGKEQWQRWPETTTDRSGDPSKFAAGLTAFITDDDPPDWVIAAFYPVGFPRQDAQSGAHTVTARFGRDRADALQSPLNDPSKQCRCVIPAKLNRQ